MADELSTTELAQVAPTPHADSQAAPTPAADSQAAPAAGADAPKTSFEAMTQRMEQMRAAEAAKPTEAKPGDAKPDAKADDADDVVDGTPDEKKAFQGKTFEEKMRIANTKLREARSALKEHETKLAEVEPLRQKADLYEKLSAWTAQSGLEAPDVQNALQWAALMKNDPIKAFEALTPIYENLRKSAGAVLSDDLREQVDSGAITETAAEELARLRRERELLADRNTRQTQHFQDQENARQIAELRTTVASAVNAAALAIEAKDPDYGRKKDLIQTEVQALMMIDGVPQTPDQAVAQFKKAVKNVDAKVAGLLPKPRPVTQIQNGGGAAIPAPATSADAMRLRAEAMGMRVVG